MYLPCGVPTFKSQTVVNHGGHQGISFLFIAELEPICKSMAATLWYKSYEYHRLPKAIIDVYGKTFSGLGKILWFYFMSTSTKCRV